MLNLQQKAPGRTLEELARELAHDHDRLKSWRKVAEEWSIPAGTACRLATGRYDPKDFSLRIKLSLPIEARVIPVAGAIPDGTQALMAQQCPSETCGHQWFISNHPLRRKCFVCSPFRKRKKKETG